jgi:drug/metabolite transporter (DMT)-like permease
MPGKSSLEGIILVSISAISFGTLAIFGRYAYAGGLDTFTLLFLRFSFSTILMVILLAWQRQTLPRGKTLWQLVGMGAIGYVGQSFCYLSAIKYASAGLVALLLYLYPIFVAILSSIFLKVKLTFPKIAALALAVLGAFFTANPQGGQWLGIFLALSSALIYSIYIVVGSGVMKKVSSVQSSTVIFTSASLVYGIMIAINGVQWPDSRSGWLAIAGMTLIATVIPVATFLAGLKRIGPTNAAMLSTLEPMVTVLLAALLFGEILRPLTLLGGALILAGVILMTRAELSR